jgi:hypothetical protein
MYRKISETSTQGSSCNWNHSAVLDTQGMLLSTDRLSGLNNSLIVAGLLFTEGITNEYKYDDFTHVGRSTYSLK